MGFFDYYVRYEPLDTVNVLFRDARSGGWTIDELLQEILGELDRSGWGRGLQGSQFLETQSVLASEDAWRTKGRRRISRRRFHARFWKVDDEVRCCAHYEKVALTPRVHEVTSFDDGRDEMEQVFRPTWHVTPQHRHLPPGVRHPPCDGDVTLIEPR